jgi:putative spermidine/putrescine transport system ATP-binding protein
MSDRIAVFNAGRLEQVGTPAEIYERPATAFVADFVGATNVIDGLAAQRLLGTAGRFTVRPEKIRVATPDAPVAHNEHSTLGTVREVVYLGAQTRLVVSVRDAPDMLVSQPNLTSSAEALTQRGRDVRLIWLRAHTLALNEDETDLKETED